MMASTKWTAGGLALVVPLGMVALVGLFEPRFLADRLFIAWFVIAPLLVAAMALRWHLLGGILIGVLGTYGLGLVGVMGPLGLISLSILLFLAAGFLHVVLGLAQWLCRDAAVSPAQPPRLAASHDRARSNREAA